MVRSRIFLSLVVVFFLYRCIVMGDEWAGNVGMALYSQDDVRLAGSDFPAFYGGASLIYKDPSDAYDPLTQQRAILAARNVPDNPERYSTWDRYYNPPVYSLLLAPLTLLDVRVAFGVMLVLNVVALALLLRFVHRLLAGHELLFWAIAAVVVTSQPVNYAFWHAQPTLLLAAAIAGLLLAAQEGRARRAGLFWAMLVVKPHWLIVPVLALRRLPLRMLVTAVSVGAITALAFAIVGPAGTLDYVRLLMGRGQGDLGDASFAEAVLSWSGFFRGLTAEPDPLGTIVMATLTLLFYGLVRRRGDDSRLPLAGALTLLMVIPHSHPQDWIMLVPGAALFLKSQRSAAEMALSGSLLLFINFGIDDWTTLPERMSVIYWPTFAGFLTLVWVYAQGEARPFEKQQTRIARRREEYEAALIPEAAS